jgi:predicted phage terminase large subunit-like protein
MQSLPPPLELRAEDIAFSRLLGYAAAQFPRYHAAPHHRLIASKLEAVERGGIKRLIISMPPRHGKSMLASEFFPAWFLGRNPDRYVIAASYAQELSDDFGRKVRNQIQDTTFKAVFGNVGLADDSTSAKRFNTQKGGAYFAVGVGGAITGRGAHLLIIDDPVKNREEAESETFRRRAWDWYTSTAYTRLMPDGAIVVIMTRWHEDDLVGRILREHNHEGWEVLELPAIDERGVALWPEQYSITVLENIRRTIGNRDWSALYQQKPTPDEGDYFKREWVHWYDTLPTHLAFYGASDYAVTSNGGDYTCHLVGGVDPDGNIYIPPDGFWRGQSDSLVWVNALIELIKHFKPVAWAEETGQIRSALDPLITRRQREEQAWCYREAFPTRGDKAVRAQSIRGRMAQHMVYLPKGAPWVDDFIGELLNFPAGKNDDQVDAFGLLGQLLDKMFKGKPKDAAPPLYTENGVPTFNGALTKTAAKRKRI